MLSACLLHLLRWGHKTELSLQEEIAAKIAIHRQCVLSSSPHGLYEGTQPCQNEGLLECGLGIYQASRSSDVGTSAASSARGPPRTKSR